MVINMPVDEIQKMEDRQVPKGKIDIVGIGRLGLRIGEALGKTQL